MEESFDHLLRGGEFFAVSPKKGTAHRPAKADSSLGLASEQQHRLTQLEALPQFAQVNDAIKQQRDKFLHWLQQDKLEEEPIEVRCINHHLITPYLGLLN